MDYIKKVQETIIIIIIKVVVLNEIGVDGLIFFPDKIIVLALTRQKK